MCLSVRYHGAKAQGTASWQEASVSQAEQQAASTAVTDVAPQCPKCGADLSNDETYARYRVCGACGHHFTLSADERIRLLVDPGSFQEFNRHLVSVDPLVFSDRLPYRKRILQAREQTGLREAVVTGIARIRGHEVVLAVLDFRFLGGSMGSVVGEKITLAFERAAERRLPIITVAASGGARMQEGILSLVQMAKTTAAAKRAHDSNVPYISVLTHPTTGGIYASFANQGDIILAEPGALIGFAGPRVVKETAHTEPVRSHSAEFLLEHGFVDQVVDRRRLRDTIALILRLLQARAELPERTTASPIPQERPTRRAWEVVQLARRPDRPTTLDYIRRISPQFVELHGDRLYGDDPAIVGGIGEIAGHGVIIIGHERGHGDPIRRNGQALPEGYRKAIRLFALASRLRLPVLTFIDTPGAYLGEGAEERGIASAISESIAAMTLLPVPTIAVIIGEGGSGGALALAVADRVLMQEHTIYSVISPEGAAAILYRDAARAPEVAESLKITAADLKRFDVIDDIVPEPEGGAHRDPDYAAALLLDAIVRHLGQLVDQPPERLIRERWRKFRRMGQTNTYLRELVTQEVSELSALVSRTFGSLRERLPFTHDDTEEHLVTPS